WSGTAANAANGALGSNLNQIMTLQDYLATVITWHRHIGDLIVQAKSDIEDNVDSTQREISILENDTELDPDERATAINQLINGAHGANVSVVSGTAEQVLQSKSWQPPTNALKDLLNQKAPPSVDVPTLVGPKTPSTPIDPLKPIVPDLPTPGPITPINPLDPLAPFMPKPDTPYTPVSPVTQ